jgi:TrmH family RNA methyltransferase
MMHFNSHIRVITSPANEDIKAVRALAMRKERKSTGLFVAEGLRHVIEGIECNWVLEKLIYNNKIALKPEIDRVRRACIAGGGLCLEVSDAVLEKLSHKDNPQQVIGVFKQKISPLSHWERAGVRVLVALEQIRDPGNLGTILRTVDGVGADGVILIDQCCDPFSLEAVRASMGSLFAVPIATCSSAEFLSFAKNWSGQVVGTHLSDRTVDYRAVDYKQPLLLVMGNEQAGLSDALSSSLPTLVKLPMSGRADSLNLAIATGVMLYKILKE